MTAAQPQSDGSVRAPVPVTSARRGRPSSDRSAAITAEILDVATELFLANGFDGTSMEAVAARASIPKTTLYKRFADKFALLRGVIDARIAVWSVEDAGSLENLPEDLPGRLRHHATRLLKWSTKPEVRAFTDLALSASRRGGRFSTLHDFFAYNEMADFLEGEIRRFGPPSGLAARDPRRVTLALMSLIRGTLDAWDRETSMPGPRAAEEADFLVDILVRGKDAW